MSEQQQAPEQQKYTVKETKEFMIGINEISLLLVQRFSDGMQLDDATAIWDKIRNDPDFRAKVEAAYDNYQLIPKELGDLDMAEGMELGATQLQYVPKFLTALKKSTAA